MRRLYQIIRLSTFSLAAWTFLIALLLLLTPSNYQFQVDPFNSTIFFVVQFPFYCLVMFGCYSLIAIGWNLFILSDCDEAQKELMD
mmetsp:Transcript_18971/g.18113  ORF Transcript_18971/g.18113 Transcript_18971/m.18113 type:complete len:86 (+) Transcript_18971:22-279(+)